MVKTYTTIQGDMWDAVAKKLYGDEATLNVLLGANQRYADIVVLLRGHSQKKDLKKVFEQNNIPSHILLKDGFSQAPGILTIMAVLKYIINPLEEISLLAILKNLFDFSDDELALLKIMIILLKNIFINIIN